MEKGLLALLCSDDSLAGWLLHCSLPVQVPPKKCILANIAETGRALRVGLVVKSLVD